MRHAVGALTPDTGHEYPAGQAVHEDSPGSDAKKPGVHGVAVPMRHCDANGQVKHAVKPAIGACIPARQVTHAVAATVDRNVPIWHGMARVMPDELVNEPAVVMLHADAPAPDMNDPGEHATQMLSPVTGAKLPGAHAGQADRPTVLA